MKLKLKNTPEQVELIKAMGSETPVLLVKLKRRLPLSWAL